MHRRAVLFALLAGAGCAPNGGKVLSADELRQILEKGDKNLFFIDVREHYEIRQSGSIEGYVNIPLGQLESRLREIPRDKVIITA
jgi:rhodanese-related sulfurtransferase